MRASGALRLLATRNTVAFMSNKPRRTAPPAAQTHRHTRLEHLLHDELHSLIRDDARDSALEDIVVLSVHLSPDHTHARVAYAVEGAPELEGQRGPLTLEGLTRATAYLRARLAENLDLKKLPKLTFTFVGMVSRPGSEPWPE